MLYYKLEGNTLTIVSVGWDEPQPTFTLHYNATEHAIYGPAEHLRLMGRHGSYAGNLKCEPASLLPGEPK